MRSTCFCVRRYIDEYIASSSTGTPSATAQALTTLWLGFITLNPAFTTGPAPFAPATYATHYIGRVGKLLAT